MTGSLRGVELDDGVVRLRGWREDDLDRVTEIISADREISRWTRIPWPYSHAVAREWFAAQAAEAEAGVALSLAVTDAVTAGSPGSEGPPGSEDLLGSVGLHRIGAVRREGSSFFPNEVGYWLAPAARGRGVATRAVRLVVRWAFETLGLERVEASTVVGNVASERVVARVGFEPVGVVEGLDDDSRPLRRFTLARPSRTLSGDD